MEAVNCAIGMIAQLMNWCNEANNEGGEEGRRVAVTQVVGRIEKIVIAINSLHYAVSPLEKCQ